MLIHLKSSEITGKTLNNGENKMADFIQTNHTKTSVRDLAVQFPDLASFTALVQSIIIDNPFACTSYEVGEVTIDPVTVNRENYTAKVVFEDVDAKKIGTASIKAPSEAAFTAAAAEIMANAALQTAIGGTPFRDLGHDTYYCQLKCHDANGEIYYLTFTRNRLRLSSYADEAIRTNLEAWADGVPALA